MKQQAYRGGTITNLASFPGREGGISNDKSTRLDNIHQAEISRFIVDKIGKL